MNDINNLYTTKTPEFLSAFCNTEPMQRLHGVGMNCGCEYTSFHVFRRAAAASRYEHSVGTALIVWNFTRDTRQTLAALFHDIATPVFAHTIDFLNGDYDKQESTEADTARILRESAEITALLAALGITPDEVCDYHVYPIADNDSPKLSADRLEYTLRNAVGYGFASSDEVKKLYGDLTVVKNEDGSDELAFCSDAYAVCFAGLALATGRVYCSPEDRCAMELLARLIRRAIGKGVIIRDDLNTTEPQVIEKLCADREMQDEWRSFCAISRVECFDKPIDAGQYLHLTAKKRYIDPLGASGRRASGISPELNAQIEDYLAQDFSEWMKVT